MRDDENVTKLPVRFKVPLGEEGHHLKVLDRESCNHAWFYSDKRGRVIDVTYLIREGETEVECSNCAAKLDPMWVLLKLAHKETGWRRAQERYHEEMKRLDERTRTQCDHCGKMTRISRRKHKP